MVLGTEDKEGLTAEEGTIRRTYTIVIQGRLSAQVGQSKEMKSSGVRGRSTWEVEATELNASGWRELVSSCIDDTPGKV